MCIRHSAPYFSVSWLLWVPVVYLFFHISYFFIAIFTFDRIRRLHLHQNIAKLQFAWSSAIWHWSRNFAVSSWNFSFHFAECWHEGNWNLSRHCLWPTAELYSKTTGRFAGRVDWKFWRIAKHSIFARWMLALHLPSALQIQSKLLFRDQKWHFQGFQIAIAVSRSRYVF